MLTLTRTPGCRRSNSGIRCVKLSAAIFQLQISTAPWICSAAEDSEVRMLETIAGVRSVEHPPAKISKAAKLINLVVLALMSVYLLVYLPGCRNKLAGGLFGARGYIKTNANT